MGLKSPSEVKPMNVDQCRATVFLHEPLRQSLATWLGGKEVASMQRCALNGGHRGEHLGSPDAEGKASFRWDECGFHIGSAQGQRGGLFASRPESASTARAAASTAMSTTTRPTGGRHYAADADPPDDSNRRSQTHALWALTAAVERLTDVVSAAGDRGVLNGRGGPTPS
jgi:hypothetical protein